MGRQQLNATIDRPDIDAKDWAANVSYGRHKLHHLFPTVDHALLPQLLPVVRETCREFGLTMGIEKTQREMCRGVWQQARRGRAAGKLLARHRSLRRSALGALGWATPRARAPHSTHVSVT